MPWNTRWTTSISAPLNCGGIFDYPAKRSRLDEVVRLSEDPALWSDAKRAQDIGKERKALEAVVGTLDRVAQELQDNRELLAMARAEDDAATLESVAQDVGKIETAVANGIERRPQRAPSAQMLAGAVAQVRAAIGGRDGLGLDAAIGSLTATCNTCHRAEKVSFITVAPPNIRVAPVHAVSAGPEEVQGGSE